MIEYTIDFSNEDFGFSLTLVWIFFSRCSRMFRCHLVAIPTPLSPPGRIGSGSRNSPGLAPHSTTPPTAVRKSHGPSAPKHHPHPCAKSKKKHQSFFLGTLRFLVSLEMPKRNVRLQVIDPGYRSVVMKRRTIK